jgi:alpha-glucosidase
VPTDHLQFAVDRQEKDPDSVLQMFRRFIGWRRGHPALIRGALQLVPSPEAILAFERSLEGERLLCVFNFSNNEAIQEIPSGWKPIEGHGFNASLEQERLHLPRFGAWFGTPAGEGKS